MMITGTTQYTPAMLRDEPPSFMQMTFKSSDEQADESLAELNEAIEREAPIDIPLSESQILEQTSQDLDVNYDSRENLDYTESGETSEEFDARLIHLLECMKDLSNINSRFRELFLSDDVLDENWPRNLSPTEKIEQYEQCFSKIVELDINDYWEFPYPNYFQRMIYRGPNIPRLRRVLSVRPGSPVPGHSSASDPVPDPDEEEENNEDNEEQVYAALVFSESNDDERSLLIRYAYRAEILSMQLNNVLGRPNFSPPLIHEGDTNTHRGLNTRYDYLTDIMNERESEIPTLNQNPSASFDHTSLISQQFLRASIQSGQESQTGQECQTDQAGQIDLSDSQVDLNSNIQMTCPESSATSFSFTENTSENHFTGNTSTGNGNDSTGTGNTTNYWEIGQDLIAQQLTSTNIDSFALIYNDGNGHFQGSAPNATYDLSSIEPIDGVNSTIESHESLADDQELNHDINWPFRFEN